MVKHNMSFDENHCDLCGKPARCCCVETGGPYFYIMICENCANEVINKFKEDE